MATQQMHTYCAMCISRCGVIATVEEGRFTKVSADPEHPNGCICVKGTAAPEIVYSPDRLQYPMKRTRPKGDPAPGWTRISWDEAIALTASRLADIKARYGPEAVVFGCATAAGTAAADFFPWVQRLANAFGSPNLLFANPSAALADLLLPAASCWERAALRSSLGAGGGTRHLGAVQKPRGATSI